MKFFIFFFVIFIFKDIFSLKNEQFFLKSAKKNTKKNYFKKKEFYFHKNGNKILSFSIEEINPYKNGSLKDNIEFYLLIDNAADKNFNLVSNKKILNENDWKISIKNFENSEEIIIKKIKSYKEPNNFSEKKLRFGNLFKITIPNLNLNSKSFVLKNRKDAILEFEI